MGSHVVHQRLVLGVKLVADFTGENITFAVQPLMARQRGPVLERLATLRAEVWLVFQIPKLARVLPHVLGQVGLICERHLTLGALMISLAAVYPHVALHLSLVQELFVTFGAGDRLGKLDAQITLPAGWLIVGIRINRRRVYWFFQFRP